MKVNISAKGMLEKLKTFSETCRLLMNMIKMMNKSRMMLSPSRGQDESLRLRLYNLFTMLDGKLEVTCFKAAE